MKVDFLIIGAGPTGLGAARQLQSLGVEDWCLLEQTQTPGGLAASFRDEQGFTWDIGGHVQFSHYEYFDQAMIEFLGVDGWLSHERESWVWMRDRFIPYPFQNNLHRLPIDDLSHCLQGLVDITKNPRSKPENFQQWIDAKFGTGIAEVFLNPYNFKVWAYRPEQMNAVWVGERVAVTDLGRVLENVLRKKDDLSWGPNNTFQFPKRGGTGAIWQAAYNRLPPEKIQLGQSVQEIDLSGKRVRTASGAEIEYQHLISTIPLTQLLRLSGQQQFSRLANEGLRSSTSHIFGVGLSGCPPEELATKCWMYFPEENCPFYRVTVFSNYSPYNVPDIKRHWSLMAEVSESDEKPVDRQTLFEEVIQGMLNTRLFSDRSQIVSKWSFCAGYGYPTPGLRRDEALETIIPFFESRNVYSRGRFGMWKYEVSNQDHSFMQGVEIVERLINSRTEITAFDANLANSKKHPWPFEQWKSV
jgi:protoporphyrinogen oxidase